MDWQIIDSGNHTGRENMDIDQKLFLDFSDKSQQKIFRIYGWSKPCISIGFFQDTNKITDREGWDVIKRPTGGGICYHTTDEISYSVVAAKNDPQVGGILMESYFKISKIILGALHKLNINAQIGYKSETLNTKFETNSKLKTQNSKLCFDQTREYEITLNGKKIVGSAQRMGRIGFLQQGTIMTSLTGLNKNLIIKSILNEISPA